MRCPYCGALDTQVKDSRPTEDADAIRRRRVCVGDASLREDERVVGRRVHLHVQHAAEVVQRIPDGTVDLTIGGRLAGQAGTSGGDVVRVDMTTGHAEFERGAPATVRFDGLSLEQAGVVLGAPVGTIKSRLARGRDRLSDEMKEYLA